MIDLQVKSLKSPLRLLGTFNHAEHGTVRLLDYFKPGDHPTNPEYKEIWYKFIELSGNEHYGYAPQSSLIPTEDEIKVIEEYK